MKNSVKRLRFVYMDYINVDIELKQRNYEMHRRDIIIKIGCLFVRFKHPNKLQKEHTPVPTHARTQSFLTQTSGTEVERSSTGRRSVYVPRQVLPIGEVWA